MSEIVDKKPQVDVSSSSTHLRSKMPFNYRFANTLRFGEYSPFFVMETVNGDKIPFSSRHDLRSYTLKSPILSDLRIHKDFFNVPMEAILPLNWDKIYTNPVQGDDVVASDVNCILKFDYNGKAIDEEILYFYSVVLVSTTSQGVYLDVLKSFLRLLAFDEYFLSSGSLLNTLGCKSWTLSRKDFNVITFNMNGTTFNSSTKDYDSFFDDFIVNFCNNYSSVLYIVGNPSVSYDLTPKNLVNFIRSTESWNFAVKASATLNITDFISFGNTQSSFFKSVSDLKSINISRVLAYQLVCSHFYSNDKVDYIYSANLYRDNQKGILKSIDSTYTNLSFSYNGVQYFYDIFSGKILNQLITDSFSIFNNGNGYKFFNFFANIFSYNRSLRFVDYFTGSRVSPLAVGDVNVAVNNTPSAHVSAIDVTRSIQMQRFLNFVNRTGRKFEEYVSKLGGNYVSPDYHNPFVISLTDDKVVNTEVENTGSAQITEANSTTSVYRSGSSRFVFNFESDRPSILIGICYFDLPRFYNSVTERQFFHIDRFDMFNPFMQFIGDQQIYSEEYNFSDPGSLTFGYQMRNEEYKVRVDQCAGAFANDFLPSWLYMANPDYYFKNNISPEFIRSKPEELDKFFVSLNGYSLGHYFHFICKFTNECEPSRPMSYQPQIL